MGDRIALDNTSSDLSSADAPAHRSAEELVAEAIAPVKRDFLRPPPVRNCDDKSDGNKADEKATASNDVVLEHESALHICPEVAKSGKVSSCRYNENCRYSHDLEAFKARKPDDLDGICPFTSSDQGPCPYGLACRFGGTHKDDNGELVAKTGANGEDNKNSEMNVLKKDVQRLLWTNKMKFPNADASLKHLGLLGNDSESDAQIVANDSDDVELTPPKKTQCSIDETCFAEPETVIVNIVEDNDKCLKLHRRERKLIDFREKLYLSPLTTLGNLPYRRVCKVLGADVTCGQMAMCTSLLEGQASEWDLLRRHSSEDLFGVQICGAYPDTVAKTVELIEQHCTVDFVCINMGCPIDIVCNMGAGCGLLKEPMRMKSIVEASSRAVDTPVTIKVRTGYFEGENQIDSLIKKFGNWGASAVTIHGRTRQQRYSELPDWDYVYQCARAAPPSVQVIGNGDVFSYLDWNNHISDCPELSTCEIARGALIKPWIFTEIKEQRHWDISSGERFDILKDYVRFGLQHWGSDSNGVETTRHFLLEWLSYTCRYIPVGLLDVIPQRINWQPPSYFGRDELETLMASDSAADWIKISEMLLGKVNSSFTFAPKHKSNAYASRKWLNDRLALLN
ncbi:tRNA-dihydrouridine(47) synthase [NAD(P)(+)]-like [Phtheirospermum japonicum]|uniref:tRNA-dihydrouridine(47) synthase [NAD(P)(+)] n=1 Tax=Phtheirospermum japonicum TaxID=374723 RepID=A0A830BSL8_9LAMI|nr:tRNA-dihydrouridine(47) synthase [NAD(P)(+)]-like [Phtheirospermum japonicum]